MGDVDNIEGDVNPDDTLESESFKIEPMDLHDPTEEETQHGIRNIYTCPIDEVTFTTQDDLDRHMEEHRNEVSL